MNMHPSLKGESTPSCKPLKSHILKLAAKLAVRGIGCQWHQSNILVDLQP